MSDDRTSHDPASESAGARHVLVGGGIAALAAAVFLIREAKVDGRRIRILEGLDRPGGSLDGSGNAEAGYLTRGGRMFEPYFACTFDLLDTIPSPDGARSLKGDILAFNERVPGSSNCRLVRDGRKADFTTLGLDAGDIVNLNRLMLHREGALDGRTIGSCFERPFFDSNFWLMWSTMFSFQPWHSAVEMRRYLRRFIHLFPGFSRIAGILRTRYNQYDSIVAPIAEWLTARGVTIETGTCVEDVSFEAEDDGRRASALRLAGGETIALDPDDRLYLTLGSMTDGSTCGDADTPAAEPDAELGPGWRLWTRLAERDPTFGAPETFCGHPERTTWESFTVTLRDRAFFDFMERFSGNRTGTGGLVTFADSGWLMSIVMFHQPHFRDQAPGTHVFWGYGLRGDRRGDFVDKAMWDCTGREILRELAGQLHAEDKAQAWFEGAAIVTSRMPFITSQFMPRARGDRPGVVPPGATNFAVIGQYCEMPRDTVFTVEYSVRSAWTAVAAMTGCDGPPPVARNDMKPLVLARAARTLLHA